MVRPGSSDQRIDHYSLLRTLEDMYGLAHLGEAANADPITRIWTE
jgi:acid phosphatase